MDTTKRGDLRTRAGDGKTRTTDLGGEGVRNVFTTYLEPGSRRGTGKGDQGGYVQSPTGE